MAGWIKRDYRDVVLFLTTRCNKRCENCCSADIIRDAPADVPTETVMRMLPFFAGSRSITLTGGEPTLHPDFRKIAEAVAEISRPNVIRLTTNGSNLAATEGLHIGVIVLNINHETEEMRREARRLHPNAVLGGSGQFASFSKIGGRRSACLRIFYAGILGDRAYPCCVSPGFAGCPSVPVEDGWRMKLLALRPPCQSCGFGNREGRNC